MSHTTSATGQSSGNELEMMIANVDQFQYGEMKEVKVGDYGSVLLIRDKAGEFSAIGKKCSHYGAPLVKGSLCDNLVRCPWHGACFNIKTGDIEDFPGLDSLPVFQVKIENGKISIRFRPQDVSSSKRSAAISTYQSQQNTQLFLIVGGGPAALSAAETLRREGFQGRIVLATREKCLPYDRPKLSKALSSSAESLMLRKAEFFTESAIEVITNKEVVSVNVESRSVKFSSGGIMKYDSILIATGSEPRTLDIKGSDLDGVYTLRSPDDGNNIASRSQDKNVVIIGTSFIGMEVAAYLSNKARSVCVIGRSATPFAATLGARIGGALQKMHESKGVKFISNAATKCLRGNNERKLQQIELSDGRLIPADVCVLGIGVTPATKFLNGSDIKLTNQGFIPVDEYMQAAPGVYAAGDVAHFTIPATQGKAVSIGHYQIALKHGNVAAKNMLGKKVMLNTVPFFWTQMFGKSLRYTGYSEGFEEIIYDGIVEDLNFIAYYIKGNKVLSVATMGRDPTASRMANLMLTNHMPSADEIRKNCAACQIRL